jgi:hypothetical protein
MPFAHAVLIVQLFLLGYMKLLQLAVSDNFAIIALLLFALRSRSRSWFVNVGYCDQHRQPPRKQTSFKKTGNIPRVLRFSSGRVDST